MKAVALALMVFVQLAVAGVIGPGAMGQNPTALVNRGAIAGEVRNLDGAAAAGVRVGAVDVRSVGATGAAVALIGVTETDNAGRFRIENLPPGDYYVTAGFLDTPTYFPGVKTAAEARTVKVVAGGAGGGIDFSLVRSAGVRVTGRVTGIPTGMPPGLARAALMPVVAGPFVGGAPTEVALRADGAFDFPRIAPGSYVPRIIVLDRPMPGTAVPIVVGDRDVAGVDLTTQPIVLGRVEVEGGGPLPPSTSASGAFAASQIRIWSTESGSSQNTLVRADGLFLFSGDPGDYQVRVGTLPVGYYVRSISFGEADLLKVPLRLAAHLTAQIRIALTTTRPADAPEVKVSGRLTGLPAGTPASSQAITFTMASPTADATDGRMGEAKIYEDGTFELLRVSPGSWSINVMDLENRISGVVQTILVGDRDVNGIEIPARTSASPRGGTAQPATGSVSVRGKVLVSNSSTRLPDAVTLSIPAGGTQTATVQSDGSFSFSGIPPGNATIRIPALFTGAGLLTTTVFVGDRDVTGVELRLPELYELTGRFVFEGAAALPAELSRLQLSAQTGNATKSSLPQGGIIAMQLVPGQYQLSVTGLPNAYAVETISYGDVDLRAVPLRVDGPLKSEVVVRLSSFPLRGSLAKVTGRVTNLPAAPYIQNPKIILTRDAKAGGGAMEAPVNKDGGFEFKALPPGPYTLTTYGLTSDFTSKVEVKDTDISELPVTLGALAMPYFPGSSIAAAFSPNEQITIRGVIAQEITQIRPPAPASFLRMEVPNAAGELKSWAVVLSLPRNLATNPADIAKLKPGTRVVAVGYPSNDGTNRIYLVPLTGPATVFGIEVIP